MRKLSKIFFTRGKIMDEIEEIFETLKTIAILGLSPELAKTPQAQDTGMRVVQNQLCIGC